MATRKRRQYGTGSVTQRKDGRWQGSFVPESGALKRIYVYAPTEALAKSRLLERQRQVAENGVPDENVSVRDTVKTWAPEWSEMRVKKVRPKTFATDESALRKWILPTIGHKRLSALKPADIRAVENAQRAAGRSTSTMNRTHSTLTALLQAAILEGHAVPRRVLDVPAATLAVNDRTNMSIPEALQVLYVASHLPHGSRWAMALLHGWRQAECLGLTWSALNLDVGLVTAEWQLQQLHYVDNKDKSQGFRIPDGFESRQLEGRFHLTRPKTKKGYRVSPLEPAMTEALRHWREVAPANAHDLVWPTLTGRPTDDKADRQEWYAIQGTAGVGHPAGRYYTVHEARHTTASELLELGADPHDATALMGHSSIQTTRGYQHPSQRAGLAIVERLADTFQIELFNLNQREALSRDSQDHVAESG